MVRTQDSQTKNVFILYQYCYYYYTASSKFREIKIVGIMLALRDTPSQRFRHIQFGTASITVVLHFTREIRPSAVYQSSRFPPRRRRQIF